MEIKENERNYYQYTEEIELQYVEKVVKATRDLAKRVYQQSFRNPDTWAFPEKIDIKTAVEQVSEIVKVLQLDLRDY